jgi:CBS domain-containing protein
MVIGMPVLDPAGGRVGRVVDLVADGSRGAVAAVVVGRRKERGTVPWASIESFSTATRRIALALGATVDAPVPSDAEALLLRRDVLDRQIIDIQGRKVVRVNDIALERVGSVLVLRSVETGLASAVRRLLAGFLSPPLLERLSAGFSQRGIPWDYVGMVEAGSARIRLKVHQQLVRMHPADLADILEDLGRVERRDMVASLDLETAAQALAEADPSVQAALVEAMPAEQAADLLEEMPPDEAADILGDLSEERSRQVLAAMESEEAEEIRELLAFDEDSAGGLMTTEFFRARSRWTVGETLAEIQKVDDDLLPEMDEVPVVDDDDRLRGMVPIVRLVRASGGTPVVDLVRRETRAVVPATPLAEVVERFDKYNLRALAVVEEGGGLAGIINIEDVFRRLAQED